MNAGSVVQWCQKCTTPFAGSSDMFYATIHNSPVVVCKRCFELRAHEIAFGPPKTATGVKHDNGKPRPSLVIGSFAAALEEVSKVGTYGAAKYTDDGWATVPNGLKRYTDAMMRHQLAEFRGETHDPESGLHHAAHAAWNALARLELILREKRDG